MGSEREINTDKLLPEQLLNPSLPRDIPNVISGKRFSYQSYRT